MGGDRGDAHRAGWAVAESGQTGEKCSQSAVHMAPTGGGGAGGSDSDVNVGLCFQSSNVSSVVYTLTTYLKWELKSFILSKLRRDALGE